MKFLKSILSLLAVAAVTMSSAAFAAEITLGGESAGDSPFADAVYTPGDDTLLLNPTEELPPLVDSNAPIAYYFFATGATNAILAIDNNGEYRLAYCYNHKKAYPNGTAYNEGVPFDGQEHDEKTERKVRAILRAGYPFDAEGLQAKYGYNNPTPAEKIPVAEAEPTDIEPADFGLTVGDAAAYDGTQIALWSVLDGNLNVDIPYVKALLAIAENAVLPETEALSFSAIELSAVTGEDDLYQSNPITCYGYRGEAEIDSLPEGFTAHVIETDGSISEATTTIPTVNQFILRCDAATAENFDKDQKLSITVTYSYKRADEVLYYSTDERSSISKSCQNLLSFTEDMDSTTMVFTIVSKDYPDPVPDPIEPDPNPDEPIVPDVPDEPVVPDVPDEPVVPDVPDEPVVPDVPDEPVVPDVPDEPVVPDVPDEPVVPDVPDEPVVPDVPDNNTPDNNVPDNNTPDNNVPDNNTPDNNVPDNNTPDNNTPDNNTPDNNVPDNNTPDNNVPDNNTPVVIPDEPIPTGGTIFGPSVGDPSVDFPETVNINDEDAPLASAPEISEEATPELVDIFDDELPLGMEPQTSDASQIGLMAALLGISLGGMAALALALKRLSKKEAEENN